MWSRVPSLLKVLFASASLALGLDLLDELETDFPIQTIVSVPEAPPFFAQGLTPLADRVAGAATYMEPTCQVVYKGMWGSGTVIRSDAIGGDVWVLSCGHIFTGVSGRMSAKECARVEPRCDLTFFYRGGVRLAKPERRPGTLVFYHCDGMDDVSLIRSSAFGGGFRSVGLAPPGYRLARGTRLHSPGCDGGGEVADYRSVYWRGLRDAGGQAGYVTVENSPRPGRSGGGLMTREPYLVGVCCRTSEIGGRGLGYFMTLDQVRSALRSEGFGWLAGPPPGP